MLFKETNTSQIVDIGSHIAKLDNKGNWKYVEKSLKSDTLYGRKETKGYQDKAEISVLETVETDFKNEYQKVIKQTTIEIVKYLKTLKNE